MSLGEIRIERHRAPDMRRRIRAIQLVSHHSQKMICARVLWIGIAGEPVEALGVDQATGPMMGHRGCERLLETAPGIHGDISKTKTPGSTSVARPIAPEAQVDLAGVSVDPYGLIAGQRARRPERRV